MGNELAELRRLTAREEAFVEHYSAFLNGYRAAKHAKYKTPHNEAARLLKRPHIQQAIADRKAIQQERLQLQGDDVIRELQRVAFANVQDYFTMLSGRDPAIDLSDMTREEAAAIVSIQVEDFVDGRGEDARQVRRVKITMADKVKALEALCRHFGLFNDSVKLTLAGPEELEKAIDGLPPTEAGAEYQRMIAHVKD